MPVDDLDNEASERTASEKDASPAKSVDYAAKYRGEQRRNEKLQREYDALQKTYEDALTEAETLKAQVKNGSKDLQTKFDALQSEFDTTSKKASKLEKDLQRFQLRDTTRNTIREKRPELLDMLDSGDLKNPDDFEKPEDFEAYLERQSSRIKAVVPDTSKRDRAAGTTPKIPVGTKAGTGTRTKEEIENEMWAITPDTPDKINQRVALENEWDEVDRMEKQR